MSKKLLAVFTLGITLLSGCFFENKEEMLLNEVELAKELRENNTIENGDWKIESTQNNNYTQLIKDGDNFYRLKKVYSSDGTVSKESEIWLIKEENTYLFFDSDSGTYGVMDLSNDKHVVWSQYLKEKWNSITSLQNILINLSTTCSQESADCDISKNKKTKNMVVEFTQNKESGIKMELESKGGYLLRLLTGGNLEHKFNYDDQTITIPNKGDYTETDASEFLK